MTGTPDDGALPVAGQQAAVTHEIERGERPSDAVVRAVTSVTNTPALELEPLYGVVDPEQLNGMFANPGDAGAGLAVSFRDSGCRVTVMPESVHVAVASGEDE